MIANDKWHCHSILDSIEVSDQGLLITCFTKPGITNVSKKNTVDKL